MGKALQRSGQLSVYLEGEEYPEEATDYCEADQDAVDAGQPEQPPPVLQAGALPEELVPAFPEVEA